MFGNSWLSMDRSAEHLGIGGDTEYKCIERKDMPAHRQGISRSSMRKECTNGAVRMGRRESRNPLQGSLFVLKGDAAVGFDINEALIRLEEAEQLYSRLAVIVGLPGSGKSALLREMAARLSREVTNVNLELSKRMLDLTFRQRTLGLGELLSEVAGEVSPEPILLDNIEMLFEPSLTQDPVRLLKGLARNRTVVAAWNGLFRDGFLTYAEPSHPEYHRTCVQDFVVIPEIDTQTGED